MTIELREYVDSAGRSPFAAWFGDLAPAAAAMVTVGITRLGLEYRLDWGPGYRVYFARDGDLLIILLAGGTKRRQQADIDAAKARWVDDKQRKRVSR